MKFFPLSDNDARTINLVLEELVNTLNVQQEKIAKIEQETIVKSTVVEEATVVEEEETETEEPVVSTTPSMKGFTPTITPLTFTRALRVSWSDWSGYGTDEVLDYSIYKSTEAVCTINEANLEASNVKSSPYIIRDLSRGQTYDVRIVARGVNGSGAASE